MTLDRAPRAECAVVTDGDQRLLHDGAAVVEDPVTDPDAQQPPDHILERCAVEKPDRARVQFPETFVPPEVWVIDRAEPWAQGTEGRTGPFEEHEVSDAERDHDDDGRRDRRCTDPVVQVRYEQGE
jgi:hypothetical protein